MLCRRGLIGLLAAAVVLGLPLVARADSLSPYVWFSPGVVTVTVVYAFPASLLAAFIERPFLTWAGFERRALVLSLRANFLSTIVGILFVPFGEPLLYGLGPLWCVIAFAISCVVEVFFLRSFNRKCVIGRIIAGNAASSAVLMVLPPIAITLRTNYYFLARAMAPHEVWLGWTAALVSLAVFLISFGMSVGPAKIKERDEDRREKPVEQ
ncbi:MAG: hypothetical protein ABFC96_01580 [Thermoguttaceae bacterium]